MAGFNHPKGKGSCCIYTLPEALQKKKSLFETERRSLLNVRVFVSPVVPSGVVGFAQDGKLIGAISNLGAEEET